MQTKHLIIAAIVIGFCALVVLLAVVFLKKDSPSSSSSDECPYCPGSTSKLGELCSVSEEHSYEQYAVSSDSNVCANAGKSILDEGGNAVDAAIAALLCMGVTIPESLGLGGGSMIVIYNKTADQATFVNAREVAPKLSFREMYNSSDSAPQASSLGPQSIAVPGELAGYWHMFEKYGSKQIKWERLFRDAIHFAENGFPVGQHLHDAMEQDREYIEKYKHLRSVYVNPDTGDLYKAGQTLKQPILAQTLKELSKSAQPRDYFYKDLAKKIIQDLHDQSDFPDLKPYITEEDFAEYEIVEKEAYQTKLWKNITIHTAPLPGSGHILAFILRVMLHPKFQDLYPGAKDDFDKAVLFYHRLMETFKFGYSRRMHLGDDRFDNCSAVIKNLTSPNFIEQVVARINDSQTYPSTSGHYDAEQFQELDHGTSHLSVLDKDGNAVSASSTVNLYFGSKVYSPSTGLILNDQMDDFNIGHNNSFDLPPAFSNFIEPGKRPLSSMSPSVFVDETGSRLIVGASGGSKITTAVALVALRHLYMNDDIKLAIDSARLHHQLFPTNVENEQCFPVPILDALRERHHQVLQLQKGVRGAIVMAVSRSKDGVIKANSDYRKGGTIAGV